MFVTAFSHFCHLLGMSRIKLLYSAFEAESFWVVAVSFVFSQECADYAVEFCVFAKQVLAVEFRNGNAPYTNQLNTTSRGKLLNRRYELIKEVVLGFDYFLCRLIRSCRCSFLRQSLFLWVCMEKRSWRGTSTLR